MAALLVRKYTVESGRKYGREKEVTCDKGWKPASHLLKSEYIPIFMSFGQGGGSVS